MRHPKTTQELRAIEALKTDNEVIEACGHMILIRPKRQNIPTDWSDLYQSTYDDNSWKRHRLTQYYPV